MTESKVKIPFPSDEAPQSDIVGILRQQQNDVPSTSSSSSKTNDSDGRAKPIALILHGVLAHKDQLYHRRLAELLPLDSFRFDFRANAESPGEWGMGDFEKDLQDLHVVIRYLRRKYNYHVESIIGHSRGALVGWYYFSDLYRRKQSGKNEEEYILDDIPFWAALSGRWRMHRIHDRDEVYEPSFKEKGYYSWNVKVLGQKVTVKVEPKDVTKFAEFPIDEKVDGFPIDSDCLILQGTADKTVPSADAGFYLNKLHEKQRRTASAQIHLVDDADHNFKGHFDHVVDRLCTWLEERRADGNAPAYKDLQRRLNEAQKLKGRL